MASRNYRSFNLSGYSGGRIDARPQNDPATQAGMRNVHRDTRGNVIGATTAEGDPLGTRRRSWDRPPIMVESPAVEARPTPSVMKTSNPMRPSAPVSRLEPRTPGLDRLAAMNGGGAGESFAAADKRKRQESAASGAFGKSSQQVAQRQIAGAKMQELNSMVAASQVATPTVAATPQLQPPVPAGAPTIPPASVPPAPPLVPAPAATPTPPPVAIAPGAVVLPESPPPAATPNQPAEVGKPTAQAKRRYRNFDSRSVMA